MEPGKILVTGGGGRLARALESVAPHTVITVARTSCDITDPNAIARVLSERRPSVVINAAVFNGIEENERHPERAHSVNAVGPENLARACARSATPLIHISTDYVFGAETSRPWRESDPTSPINTYGRVKEEGERRVLTAHPGASVVRVAWLFGDGACFLSQMIRAAIRSGAIPPANEQVGSPTPIAPLAACLVELADQVKRGNSRDERLLHLAGGPPVSRREWIASAIRGLPFRHSTHAPVSGEHLPSREFTSGTRRPNYSALDSVRAQALFGRRLDWEDISQAYVRRLVRKLCPPRGAASDR